MRTLRYDDIKRNRFVITTLKTADLDLSTKSSSSKNARYVFNILNQKYRIENFDSPPFHYIVSEREYMEVKSAFLNHSDKGYLKPYNDDIRILILSPSIEEASEKHANFCSEIIANVSSEFVMPIYKNIVLPETKNSWYTDIIERDAIKARGYINPIMSMGEGFFGEDIFINEKVIMRRADSVNRSLMDASLRYLIPLDLVQSLNFHLEEGNIRDNDVVFLPNKLSLSAVQTVDGYEKDSDFCKEYSNLLIKTIDESEGEV